jgi:threonine/homoserine/homoserine lactone efflux protein
VNELLPPLPVLAAFIAAALVLAVTPGPGVIYIVTRTLAQGRGSGLASVAGVAIGNFGNAAAASIGLAAVLAASASAFELVKYLGAAYLFYLGVQALRSKPSGNGGESTDAGNWQVLVQGFMVALLNPKTTLFFAAFLPQFMQPSAAPVLQALTLSAVFVALAAASDAGYVLIAAAVAPALRATPGVGWLGRYFSAAVYLSLSIYSAASGSRSPRA